MRVKKITLMILRPFWVALKFLGRILFERTDTQYVGMRHQSVYRLAFPLRGATGDGNGGIGPVPEPAPEPLPTGDPTGPVADIDAAYRQLLERERVNA
jgi:hypothetical protein